MLQFSTCAEECRTPDIRAIARLLCDLRRRLEPHVEQDEAVDAQVGLVELVLGHADQTVMHIVSRLLLACNDTL